MLLAVISFFINFKTKIDRAVPDDIGCTRSFISGLFVLVAAAFSQMTLKGKLTSSPKSGSIYCYFDFVFFPLLYFTRTQSIYHNLFIGRNEIPLLRVEEEERESSCLAFRFRHGLLLYVHRRLSTRKKKNIYSIYIPDMMYKYNINLYLYIVFVRCVCWNPRWYYIHTLS